jgi:hypothetical protein
MGTTDNVDDRGSTSAGGFTRGWEHGTVVELSEDEAAADSAEGARSTVRCTWRTTLWLFVSAAHERSCDCLRRKGIRGGCSVGCRDGLPVHSGGREADAAAEQSRGNGLGSEEREEEEGYFASSRGCSRGKGRGSGHMGTRGR